MNTMYCLLAVNLTRSAYTLPKVNVSLNFGKRPANDLTQEGSEHYNGPGQYRIQILKDIYPVCVHLALDLWESTSRQ